MTQPLTVPRLRAGEGVKGPSFYGCCNTGREAALIRTSDGARYIVGLDSDVHEVCRLWHRTNRLLHKRKVKMASGDPVYLFKTRAPAVALFLAMVQDDMRLNRETADHVADLRQRARAGDQSAILELSDY